MTFLINGTSRTFELADATVEGILAELGMTGKPVVVELDREPVLPAAYADTPVPDGAELEIVTIAAGG